MRGELRLQELWVSGTDGYHTFRIPSLVVTPRGTLVAICEGRKLSHHDVGLIDLQVRRSTDGGKTWSKTQTIYGEPDMTCGNPAPIVDRSTGFIWLPFCKNPAFDAAERAEKWRYDRPVWVTHSEDDGVTWAEPREITSTAKKPDWTWYSTGPVHGNSALERADDRVLYAPGAEREREGRRALRARAVFRRSWVQLARG